MMIHWSAVDRCSGSDPVGPFFIHDLAVLLIHDRSRGSFTSVVFFVFISFLSRDPAFSILSLIIIKSEIRIKSTLSHEARHWDLLKLQVTTPIVHNWLIEFHSWTRGTKQEMPAVYAGASSHQCRHGGIAVTQHGWFVSEDSVYVVLQPALISYFRTDANPRFRTFR
jgi:hypothetical protein